MEITGFSPAGPDLLVDIRTKAGDATTSLVSTPKPVEEDGQASLLVENEDMEGEQALVIVLTPEGVIQAQTSTTLGDGTGVVEWDLVRQTNRHNIPLDYIKHIQEERKCL